MTHTILVARDFSPYPVGRIKAHGENNGRRFRKEKLLPALADHPKVIVDFTGVKVSIGPSFLDESIAGLVWHEGMSEAEVRDRVAIIIPEDDTMVASAWQWVHEAEMDRTGRTEEPGRNPGAILQLVACG